ncbi:MAG: hypothetical protein NTX56_05925 [Proteobacteria bacterium]|nr:hypothetical protein [Pseudomonadota bacterium]
MTSLAVANDALGLPTGLVNADCDPQGKHTPIVLIHGTFASTRRAFSTIGHSQGGLLAFMIARSAPLAGRIDRLVALAPSLNGTTRVPAGMSMKHCPACSQQSDQSEFIQSFRKDNVNPSGVRALIVATRQDLVVTPVSRQFLDEPDVTNILLQDLHPTVVATHSGMLHKPETIELVRAFLSQP